jgi:ferrous iron transport protein A
MQQKAFVHESYVAEENRTEPGLLPAMPLSIANAGQRVRIVCFAGGRGICRRLSSMGLNVGGKIEILRRGYPGPFLVASSGTRLAIGAGMAHKIMVSAVCS